MGDLNKAPRGALFQILGKREDIPELLSITDIVVSASRREWLPVNVIEALAADKPVVALECRGVEDLIENGRTGYICKNIEDFYEKLIETMSDGMDITEYNKYTLAKADINNVINKMKNCIVLMIRKED